MLTHVAMGSQPTASSRLSMAISNIGLWPKSIVDSSGCPFDGDPPSLVEGGPSIIQPLSSLDLASQLYVSWKIKTWKIDVNFNVTIEWEREGDGGPETGTTQANRSDSFSIQSRNLNLETITNQQKIGCEFTGWGSEFSILVYDGGVGIDFLISQNGPPFQYSSGNGASGVFAFFPFNVPVEITFNGQTINTQFYTTIGSNPPEIYDENPPYRFMTGASFSSGKITISEEETW